MRNIPELSQLMEKKEDGAIEMVFEAIRKEREYQDRLWGGTQEQGVHSVTEYLVFIQDYVQEALHICSRKAAPYCNQDALHIVRKVAAMAVACMEQNGIEQRDMGDLDRSCELHSVECKEDSVAEVLREAKAVLGLKYAHTAWFRGIGIAKLSNGLGLRLNVAEGYPDDLPSEYDGFPVEIIVVEYEPRVTRAAPIESAESLKDEEQEICEALGQQITPGLRKELLQEIKVVQQQLRDLRKKGARYGY